MSMIASVDLRRLKQLCSVSLQTPSPLDWEHIPSLDRFAKEPECWLEKRLAYVVLGQGESMLPARCSARLAW